MHRIWRRQVDRGAIRFVHMSSCIGAIAKTFEPQVLENFSRKRSRFTSSRIHEQTTTATAAAAAPTAATPFGAH